MFKIPEPVLARALDEALRKSGLPNLLDAKPEEFEVRVKAQDILRLHAGLKVPTLDESKQFRGRDIEPLIQQAMGLMLQAISDRASWQTAGEKWANLVLQLFHDWRYLVASGDALRSIVVSITSRQRALEAEQQRRATQEERSKNLARLARRMNPTDTLGNAQAKRTRFMEYARAAFGFNRTTNDQGNLPGDWGFDAQPLRDGPWSSEALDDRPVVYDGGAGGHLPDLLRDVGERAQRFSMESAYHATLTEVATSEGERDASDKVCDAIKGDIEALQHSLDAATKRRNSDEEVAAFKVLWMAYDDLLGFFQQAASSRSRYQLAAGAAFARLQAAAIGLRDLYGYEVPLPELTSNTMQSFDDVYKWLVGVVTFLAARERTSQEVALRVSVKSRSRNAWPKRIGVGSTLVFDVPETSAVRGALLRGVSAEIEGASDLSNKLIFVIDREDGTDACVLSEVRGTTDTRPIRVHGERLLFNAPPFGEWRLTIVDIVGGQEEIGAPDDVFVAFQVCVTKVQR